MNKDLVGTHQYRGFLLQCDQTSQAFYVKVYDVSGKRYHNLEPKSYCRNPEPVLERAKANIDRYWAQEYKKIWTSDEESE